MNRKRNYFGFLYLLLVGLGMGLVFILYKKESPIQLNKKSCFDYVQSSLNGVVDSCFFDYKNKGTFTFRLKNDNIEYTFPFAVISHPENYLDKGDSIVKKKGYSQFFIYKKSNPDSLITLDFDCSYWDNK